MSSSELGFLIGRTIIDDMCTEATVANNTQETFAVEDVQHQEQNASENLLQKGGEEPVDQSYGDMASALHVLYQSCAKNE